MLPAGVIQTQSSGYAIFRLPPAGIRQEATKDPFQKATRLLLSEISLPKKTFPLLIDLTVFQPGTGIYICLFRDSISSDR